MSDMLRKIDFSKNWSAILTLLFLLGLILHSAIPATNSLLLSGAKLLLGLSIFIFLPGLFVVTLIGSESITNFGFVIIFGFLLQLLNVLVIWFIYAVFGTFFFTQFIYLFTSIFVLFALIYCYKKHIAPKFDSLFKFDKFLLLCFVLLIAVSILFQTVSISPNSDGATYLDLARNVVQENSFSSNYILPIGSWEWAQYSTGMINYFFGYSGIAIFFAMGGISFLCAKALLIFATSLLLFPLYSFASKLFNQPIARLTVALTLVSPIILAHTALVGGPEVISLLFGLTAIYIILLLLENGSPTIILSMLAGILIFVAWYSWLLFGYILILSLPFIYLLHFSNKINRQTVFRLVPVLILVVLFFLDLRLFGYITLASISIPIPIGSILGLLIFSKFNSRIKLPSSLFLFLSISLFLIFFLKFSPRLICDPFIYFDSSAYSSSVQFISAHTNANSNLLTRVLDFNTVQGTAVAYLYGLYYDWTGLFASIGVTIVFLAVASIVRLEKIKETLLVLIFPLFHFLLWCLLSPDEVLQPRYFLCVAPFYFILAASTISIIFSNAKIKSKRISLTVFGKSFKIAILKGIVILFIFISLIAFWQPTYQNVENNIKIWNYADSYGWRPAIAWVQENTTDADVLMTRQANYWAWFSGRETVSLSNRLSEYSGNFTLIQFMNVIIKNKVNYLIVDETLRSSFPNFASLYKTPQSLYGAPICFESSVNGLKTVIYNVTAIQKLTAVIFVDSINPYKVNEDESYWKPFAMYSGTISIPSLSNQPVTINGASGTEIDVIDGKYQLWGVSHSYPKSCNWSSYGCISFNWFGHGTDDKFRIDIHAENSENQYQMVFTDNHYGWQKITLPLTAFSVIGSPSWASVKTVYLLSISPNRAGTWYLGDFFLDLDSAEIQTPDGLVLEVIG